MFANTRTLAFSVTRSLLPRTFSTLGNADPLALGLQGARKRIRCRYVSSSQHKGVNTSDVDDFEGESPYANVDFAAITGNDPDKLRQLRRIQLEVDMLRQQGNKVPSSLTTEQWIDLLRLNTVKARTQCCSFLWMNEYKKQRNKQKKSRLREEFLAKKVGEHEYPEVTTEGPIMYSLGSNTLFWRLKDTYIRHLYNLKLFYASMFNPHIIIDCGFEAFMSPRNLHLCVKQISLMWAENRNHMNPFHMVFCNLSNKSEIFMKVKKSIPPIEDPDFPFFFTPKHYLDVYPKEKLVYLTPHCTEELTSYNADDIYIIGAFVDKNSSEPLTLARAKKEGLRMAKFPLDRYLKWLLGTKSLTINQSLAIMNDLKDTNDWSLALTHVPSRKTQARSVTGADEEFEKISNFRSARVIREQYRRNLVYDLLMKESVTNECDESSGK